jgi:hypothetical protein
LLVAPYVQHCCMVQDTTVHKCGESKDDHGHEEAAKTSALRGDILRPSGTTTSAPWVSGISVA